MLAANNKAVVNLWPQDSIAYHTMLYVTKDLWKKVTVGDEIFLVVLFHNEITCRVLKTYRPWYTYQLTPYQVIEPEVPYLWRKIWLFDETRRDVQQERKETIFYKYS